MRTTTHMFRNVESTERSTFDKKYIYQIDVNSVQYCVVILYASQTNSITKNARTLLSYWHSTCGPASQGKRVILVEITRFGKAKTARSLSQY